MAYSPAAGGSHGTLHAHDGEHSHHPPVSVYLITFAVLMGLLIVTVVMYFVDLEKFTHFKGTNLIVAMIIAVIKAALVVLFFMNVKNSSKLTWLWAAIGFIWLFLMAGIFLDYQSRSWQEPQGWQPQPYTYTTPVSAGEGRH